MIYQADEGVCGNPIETLFVVISGDDCSVEMQGIRLTYESAEKYATEVMAHQTHVLSVEGWQVLPIPKASDTRQWWREVDQRGVYRGGTRFVRIDEVAVQE